MEASLEKAKQAELKRHSAGVTGNPFRESNAIFQARYSHAPLPTGVSKEVIQTVVQGLARIPAARRRAAVCNDAD
jgi:hypothetical protein